MAESSSGDEQVIRYVGDFSALDAGLAQREERANRAVTFGGGGTPGTPSIAAQSGLPPAATSARGAAAQQGQPSPAWLAQMGGTGGQLHAPGSAYDPLRTNQYGQTLIDRTRLQSQEATARSREVDRFRQEQTRLRDDQVAAAMRATRDQNREVARTSARVDRNWEATELSQEREQRRNLTRAIAAEVNARDQLARAAQQFASEQRQQQQQVRQQGVQQFSADLSEMGPNARLRAINQRMTGMDPGSAEFQNLRRQAAQLRGPRGGTGLNTEVLPMGQYMNLMFGGWEVASAFNAAVSMNNPVLNRGALQSMQTQQAAIQKMSSGILGSMAAGSLNVFDAASMLAGADMSTMEKGFGILGRFSPMAQQQAQEKAMRGIEQVQAQTEAAIQGRAIRSQLSASNDQISILDQGDPFIRARQGAGAEYAKQFRGLQDTQFSLRQQLATANTIGDAANAAKLVAQINQFDKDAPDILKKAGDLRDAALRDVNRAEGAMRLTNRAMQRGLAGDVLGSAVSVIEAKYLPLMNQDAQLSPVMMDAYRLDMRQAQITDRRREIELSGQSQALQFGLNRNPVAAQMAVLAANRAAAMQGVTDPNRLREIDDLSRLQIFDLAQQRADQRQDIGLNLMGRRGAITALEQRNPLGADAAQLVAQAQSEEVGLRRRGLDSEANQVRELSRRQLDLMERDYREGFQFQQLESKLLAPGLFSKLANEDPSKVFGSFQSARSALSQATDTVTPGQAAMELSQNTITALSQGIGKEILTALNVQR